MPFNLPGFLLVAQDSIPADHSFCTKDELRLSKCGVDSKICMHIQVEPGFEYLQVVTCVCRFLFVNNPSNTLYSIRVNSRTFQENRENKFSVPKRTLTRFSSLPSIFTLASSGGKKITSSPVQGRDLFPSSGNSMRKFSTIRALSP